MQKFIGANFLDIFFLHVDFSSVFELHFADLLTLPLEAPDYWFYSLPGNFANNFEPIDILFFVLVFIFVISVIFDMPIPQTFLKLFLRWFWLRLLRLLNRFHFIFATNPRRFTFLWRYRSDTVIKIQLTSFIIFLWIWNWLFNLWISLIVLELILV